MRMNMRKSSFFQNLKEMHNVIFTDHECNLEQGYEYLKNIRSTLKFYFTACRQLLKFLIYRHAWSFIVSIRMAVWDIDACV